MIVSGVSSIYSYVVNLKLHSKHSLLLLILVESWVTLESTTFESNENIIKLEILSGEKINLNELKFSFDNNFIGNVSWDSKLNSGKKILEYEEVVVGSKTMTYDEYINLRILAFIIFVTNRGIVYDSIPENEYQETLHKMQALIGAIDDAERGIK